MNSVRYCQPLELLTLALWFTWLIPYSEGMLRASKLASNGSNPFTLDMGEDSYILKADLSCWVRLVGPLVVWDSPSIGVQANILQDSYVIGIFDDPVGLFLVSKCGSHLEGMLDPNTRPTVGLQFIVDSPPGSKLRYPELVRSPSQYTLALTSE